MKLHRSPKASVGLASHADVLRLDTPSSPLSRVPLWEGMRDKPENVSVANVGLPCTYFKQFCSRLGDLSKRLLG